MIHIGVLLIIGLGNPGRRFAVTRHNFGFWVIDQLAKDWGISFRPGKGDYLIGSTGDKPALAKPTTFMNENGLSVRQLVDFTGTVPEELLLIYDDIDLPLGTIRFRPSGSAGGHKGVESVMYHLGTENFTRLRLGIATDAVMRPSESYVLRPFRRRDAAVVTDVIQRAVSGVKHLIAEGVDDTMNRYNNGLSI